MFVCGVGFKELTVARFVGVKNPMPTPDASPPAIKPISFNTVRILFFSKSKSVNRVLIFILGSLDTRENHFIARHLSEFT